MNHTLFSYGPINIYLYGLMLAIGFLIGAGLFVKEAERKKISADRAIDIVLIALISGVIGARVLFILLDYQFYLANPSEILRFDHGGLSFHGAILGGAMAVLLFVRRYKLSFMSIADAIVPAIAIGYAIARVGCDIFGSPSTAAWAVESAGIMKHPAQLYSGIASYWIFVMLWKIRTYMQKPGQLFAIYVVLYSVTRIAIEVFRESVIIFGNVTVAQAASSVFAVIAILYLWRSRESLAIPNPFKEKISWKKGAAEVIFWIMGMIVLIATFYWLQS